MFGHRDRRHSQLDGLIEDLIDAAGAVEQRVLGVEMEVDEVGRGLNPHHSHSMVEGGFELMS